MTNIMRAVLLFVVAGLAGCASAPPSDMTALPDHRYQVPVRRVIVSNFADAPTVSVTDGVWSSGYSPMPDDITNPPFTELVAERLAVQFEAGGEEEGTLDLSVLKALYLRENRIADSIPFIGIASAFVARNYMCQVELVFRYGDKSERKRFEYVENLEPRLDSEKEVGQWGSTINNCLDDIFGQAHRFALQLTEH